MIYKIKDYYEAIDKIACFSESESWDNTGIMIGSPKTVVKAALVALDVTMDVIAEARLLHANLIVTHHPIIFPSISCIDGDSLIYELISSKINVISAHTNFDKADGGVNDTLANVLSLKNVEKLENSKIPGLARIGALENSMQPEEFASFVKSRLFVNTVKYTQGTIISKVAVCGGSGSELWHDAYLAGAHALVTSEVKHHHLLEALNARFTLIDADHYATESLAMEQLRKRLIVMLPKAAISLSQAQSDPANYI